MCIDFPIFFTGNPIPVKNLAFSLYVKNKLTSNTSYLVLKNWL